MKVFSFIFIVFGMLSCSSAKEKGDDQITISGKVENIGVGNILLERFQADELKVVDTLALNEDGSFMTMYKPDEPGYYRLNFFQTQFVNFLFTGSPIIINADGNNPTAAFEIIGSKEMDYIQELNGIMEVFNNEVNQLNTDYGAASTGGDEVKMGEILAKFNSLRVEVNDKIKQKIRAMGNSLALLQAVNYLDKDQEFDFIDSIAHVIDTEIPDYEIRKDFDAEIEKLRKLAIGSVAPDIVLPDPEGNIVKLSSLRGSFVLIDFWAAWCRPCRIENPNVVRLYQKYHDKGFDVFGVSLDRKKEDWVGAIEADGLVWTHVSDLKYFNSEAAMEYGVNAIPATYLIDDKGIIIGKNLRGEALESKLSELF